MISRSVSERLLAVSVGGDGSAVVVGAGIRAGDEPRGAVGFRKCELLVFRGSLPIDCLRLQGQHFLQTCANLESTLGISCVEITGEVEVRCWLLLVSAVMMGGLRLALEGLLV